MQLKLLCYNAPTMYLVTVKLPSRLAAGFLAIMLFTFCISAASATEKLSAKSMKSPRDQDYKPFLQFFDKVYKTMEENYYLPVDARIYSQFIQRFKKRLYTELRKEGQSDNYVKWRGAAYMIQDLKSKEDIFSEFIPPKFAEKFEKKVLGKKVDLGIEGKLLPIGYVVTMIEPRSDAYVQGLRVKDIILAIDGRPSKSLKEDQVQDLLNPLVDSKVRLDYLTFGDNHPKKIEVVSQEYFKQTVFMVPVRVPGIYCLQIRSFNQKTSDDMLRYLVWIQKQENSGLILDLRGNPGGPPLAAREISAFFLPPKEEFAYFQRKGEVQSPLDVPFIPERFRYHGPLVILVNKESGSASELFSGVLQKRGRAILMGANTAGQVMLKSMFNFDDQSMLLLVTARGHFPDGSVFSFGGLIPDRREEDKNVDLVNAAALYLASEKENLQKAQAQVQ